MAMIHIRKNIFDWRHDLKKKYIMRKNNENPDDFYHNW